MQPDLVFDMPAGDWQGQCEAEHEVLAVTKDSSLQVAEAADKYREPFGAHTEDVENSAGMTHLQAPQVGKRRQRRRPSPTTWHLALLLGDGMLLTALFVLLLPAPDLRLHASNSVLGPWNANFVWLCMALASWSFAACITRAQQPRCAASVLQGPLYALYSLVLMLIFCNVFLYLFIGDGVISYIRPSLVFLLVAAPIFGTWRLILAEIINLPRFRRQAVIVGVNAAGKSVARELLRAKHPAANVVGYIGEGIDLQEQRDELPILGGKSALRTLAQNGMVDMMIMAIDYKANPELFQQALEGAQRGIAVVPVTAIYESTSGKIPVEDIGDQWHTALPTQQYVTPLYLCWHRAIDLAFGICGTVVLGLVLPLLAVLIKLDSPGPVFYRQERAGYRGRTFRILKFRSMCNDAERAKGGAWTTRSDTRVTRVGRLLRATHMDELPQVLNIVRGDMSLIGPRPERPDYVAELEKNTPFYCYRLSIRPGLTGWAQVKYGYGNGEQDELVKLQYDLFYIKHQSFLLDILIMLKTIVEVVLCHGV